MIAHSVRHSLRRGHTLVELVLAMASASVLSVGMGAAVLVTSRAFRPESTAQYRRTAASLGEYDLLADLRLACGFTERTNTAITFTVPDRDGNGSPETLRYSWSGTAGDPLQLSVNGGTAIAAVNDVRAFSLNYLTKSVPAVTLPAEQTGSAILLVVNDSTQPTSQELARKAMLESWNFSVTMLGVNDGEEVLTQSQKSQAVYISGTINAGSFVYAEKLAELPMGIVNENPDLVADFGFAAATSSAFLSSSVNVALNGHYITTGFSTGNLTIATFSSEQF